MNPLKKFLAMFKAQPPAPLRGRVTAHDPDAAGNGAFKARAKPIPGCKYRVYRAKTGTWEDFHEAQVKPEEGTD